MKLTKKKINKIIKPNTKPIKNHQEVNFGYNLDTNRPESRTIEEFKEKWKKRQTYLS